MREANATSRRWTDLVRNAVLGDLSKILLLGLVLPIALSAQSVKFAVVGDFGADNLGEEKVADLVASWDVELVTTVGDNRYGSSTYDEAVGKYYCEFLRGAKRGPNCTGNKASKNAFFPALGNHDYNDGGGLSEYLSYFNLPGSGFSNSSGNERYYDFVWGPVHFFMVNNMAYERDGTSLSSVQVQWLKKQLMASDSPWQVVFVHYPPYSSGERHGSYPDLRWPFEDWGADAVIAGHDHIYERVMKSDFPYFVNGVGGGKLSDCASRISGSVMCRDGEFGAQLVEATNSEITFSYYRVNGGSGDLKDSFSIRRKGNTSPLAQIVADPKVGLAPLKVTLDGRKSSDADGTIVSYRWDIGGSTTKRGKRQSFTFNSPGTHIVKLTVTDNDGDTHTDQIPITVPASKQAALVLRNGLDGYSGTRDTQIQRNNGFKNFGDETVLAASGAPDKAILLKWDLRDLPPGIIIKRAELRLGVKDPNSRGLRVYGAKVSWHESEATWNNASDGHPWTTAGLAAPADHDAASIGTFQATDQGTIVMNLDAGGVGLVQRWIDSPSANKGLVLKNYAIDGDLTILSSEHSETERRPALVLVYSETILSVGLVSLDVVAFGKGIQVSWQTTSEINNAGFAIEHAAAGQPFAEEAYVPGAGTTTIPQSYTHTLPESSSGRHRFRLRQVAFDGSVTYSHEVEVEIADRASFVLESLYPNPFQTNTTATFRVVSEQRVVGELFDALGRLVKVVYDGVPAAGIPESISIDGALRPPGMYVLRLRGKTFDVSRNLVLLR